MSKAEMYSREKHGETWYGTGLTAERRRQLDEQYNVSESEFKVLPGQVGYEGWTMQHVAEEYVQATDKIIGVLDGSITDRDLIDKDNPEKCSLRPDVVIYLDKSARPVSWFVDEFWDQMAQKQDIGGESKLAPKPETRFLNIDRIDWLDRVEDNEGVPLSDLSALDFDIDQIPPEDIAKIRAISAEGELTEENWQEEVAVRPNYLDNKNILIVDEVKSSGATLFIAQQLLKKAFPSSVVSGVYFWEQLGKQVGNKWQMGIAPVWYDADVSVGRMVDDKNMAHYEKAYRSGKINLKMYLGAIALSSPQIDVDTGLRARDTRAIDLRRDIEHLARALRDGRVLRRPYVFSEEERILKIITDQLPLEEYTYLISKR